MGEHENETRADAASMGGAAGEMDVDVEVGGTTGDKTRVANVEHEGDMSCDEEVSLTCLHQ